MVLASDPRAVFGDDQTYPVPGKGQKTTRRPPKKDETYNVASAKKEIEDRPKAAKPDALHFRLADLFLSQPWIHTYRGDTKPLPRLPITMHRTLVASILRDRMAQEDRFTDKAEEWVEEVVEYAMKHFFARVPNEERTGSIVNRFTGSGWWGTLIEESADHYVTVRIPPEAYEAGRKATEAYYAAWPKKVSVARAKTPREAADRFNKMRADHEARQPTYPDAEPLT